MDSQDFDFDFTERDYDSDLESNASDEEDMVVLDDWVDSVNSFSNFEYIQYTPKSNLLKISTNSLVYAIFTAIQSHRCVTAVRLLADIHDLNSEENIRWSQTMRFEISNFESISEMKQQILDYIEKEEAPVWHRLITDESSDKGYNKLVKYRTDYFDFCVQKPLKSGTQVTTICGEEEIHPGIFVKKITDHNISYRNNDCLIQCLNEILNKREDPDTIRMEIWGDKNKMDRDLHTPRHIKYIAERYNTKILLSDIIEQSNITFNRNGKNVVKLVKVGKMLGMLDRKDLSVDKRNISNNIAYFDLETVGPDQRIYAFTWRCYSGDLTMCHNNYDYIEGCIIDKVLDTAYSLADDETLIAYAWNGSRFDNWIMFKLLKKKFNKKLWIHDIIINSANELLSFKLTIKASGRSKPTHIVFKDPKKMFSVSIPEACKVFNINEGKHDFNHDEVDEAYMQGKFDEYIKENKGRMMDYVRQDGVILEKLTNCIAALYKQENINMYTVLTRSVASSIAWQKTIEHHKILKDVTLSPYAEVCDGVKYNDIMDHAIGGRTQCVKRGTFNNVCGIDVNSMYPYVCASREYPCGQIVELSKSNLQREIKNTDIPKDKLGLYLVKIKKQSYPYVVPHRKSKHYTYNWEYTKEFEKWVTSVDLQQIDEYEVVKGFYWTDKTNKFYKDFMIDNYNERVSIDKSDPRNIHIKLKMNGVTGSVFQHSFREMIMIFTKEEFEENVKKYSELVTIIGCEPINERQYIVTMRPIKFNEDNPRIKAQREFCKGAITQKPWVLTMFTYSYARKILRDEWIKLEQKGCKIIYCDTDSLFFTNPDNIISKKEYTHKDKELGKWSIECWNDEGSFYTPKVYAIKDIGKLRIKGVGYNSLVIDTKYKNSSLNYEQKLELFLNTAKCDGVHPSYRHVKELIEGKPLKTINFIMEKSSQHGIQKKYEIKIIH
jgi:hypothetical protein